ncbi:PepSY domain-containing protein [Mesorhizobium sp. NBSH29]|uniref:PepSY domain-containing protein n=1 Tax=Mesorhizobium sp. NBSH29 TaxID=2654249 RepID=UPI0018967B3A|nr:PepSY domain-containing protein [Mesorhizobium sp. NBSH29]QPC85861.1 PepSY domain-containing protein [Mesorhizobium sp. NBSH29]
MTRFVPALMAVILMSGPAAAQTKPPVVPAQNAIKLSEIITRIEMRAQFHYIEAIDWDRGGFYEITYYTTDKAKVEIKIDPVTGEARL